ncbi:MAG: C25 family cysteine peptidase, partial [Acidobacteriota bacterium]
MVAQGGEVDVSLVDTIRLTYGHTYTADADVLEFTVSGPAEGEQGQPVTIEGFSSPEIAVADMTDPLETVELEGVVEPQGETFSITVWVPDSGLRTLLAVTREQLKQPAVIEMNEPSTWNSADAGAEVVIFSHQTLLESIAPLKALRESQGYSVVVVDVQDVYDEFAFGVKTPRALHDFLVWGSEQWQTQPRFVLFFGDAGFDPRDYLGLGDLDLVPTWMVPTISLETASDDWFADFDFDGVPDLAVGRLPVRTPEEAAIVVGKIVAYDQEPEAPWKQQILLVGDQDTPGFEFEQITTELKASLGAQLSLEEVFQGQGAAEARTQLLASLNEGRLVVNYSGHGSVELWSDNLLTSQDARALTNGSRLPFFVSMTCLNGFFQDLFTESMAEALLRAEQGGAIAVWASSALTSPMAQLELEQELFRLLSQQDGLTLGEAVARAKASSDDPDVRRSWIFFGDPLTKISGLRLGPAERVFFQDFTNQGTIELLSDEGTTFERALAVANPSPQKAPPEASFPVDFVDFTVRGYTQATTVTIFLADGVRVNTFWKFGPTPGVSIPHWYEFLYDGRTGAEIFSDRIVLHFVDGERGDDDLTINGEISSRGGPAFSAPPVVPSVGQIISALNSGGTGEEMFVGMAIMNPNDYPNAISLAAMDASGTEIDRVVLSEIPAQGQDAFLISEVMNPLVSEVSVIARGQEGPIQSFFLIGDFALNRLDGVAGDSQASTQLYFPVIPPDEGVSTVLFVFNPAIETASTFFRLRNRDGVLLEEVSRTIAGGGFLAETVEGLFENSGAEEIYIQVESDVPLMGSSFSQGGEDFSAL